MSDRARSVHLHAGPDSRDQAERSGAPPVTTEAGADLAADRREWPEGPLAEEDRAVIETQIGPTRYEPRAVLTRCAAGFPQVVLGCAGRTRQGFSRQVVWLTCPYLARQVSTLESEGAIRSIEAAIRADSAAAIGWMADQRDYEGYARASLARAAAWAPVGDRPFGIGGVANLAAIKCLHAHVAWTLVSGRSGAGREALSRLEAREGGDPYLCPQRSCPTADRQGARGPAPLAPGEERGSR